MVYRFKSCKSSQLLIIPSSSRAACKVEFNQPSYWLYSVPNLLVFQHLVTLYLGGFCCKGSEWDKVLIAQECARKQRLAAWSCGWLAAASCQTQHTCQACQKVNSHASWSTTRQNRTTGHTVISRLDLATQLVARPSREPPLFC